MMMKKQVKVSYPDSIILKLSMLNINTYYCLKIIIFSGIMFVFYYCPVNCTIMCLMKTKELTPIMNKLGTLIYGFYFNFPEGVKT